MVIFGSGAESRPAWREEIFALIGGGRLGGWGRPCRRWRMEIESGGHLALGIPSLAG